MGMKARQRERPMAEEMSFRRVCALFMLNRASRRKTRLASLQNYLQCYWLYVKARLVIRTRDIEVSPSGVALTVVM